MTHTQSKILFIYWLRESNKRKLLHSNIHILILIIEREWTRFLTCASVMVSASFHLVSLVCVVLISSGKCLLKGEESL